jgi:hypothetical protein
MPGRWEMAGIHGFGIELDVVGAFEDLGAGGLLQQDIAGQVAIFAEQEQDPLGWRGGGGALSPAGRRQQAQEGGGQTGGQRGLKDKLPKWMFRVNQHEQPSRGRGIFKLFTGADILTIGICWTPTGGRFKCFPDANSRNHVCRGLRALRGREMFAGEQRESLAGHQGVDCGIAAGGTGVAPEQKT